MITLKETRQGCAMMESKPRYHVMFNGKFHGELYFNMTGYTGCYLPTPTGNLNIGEVGISTYRKEIAKLNKEWKNANLHTV